uniref:Uncharacterized protein n=1 Tax=Cynoglossus semilaevis TaxID=244447 RepID=A0A3P8UYS2_CYNSE
ITCNIFLVVPPVSSTSRLLFQDLTPCCGGKDVELKRFDDYDYDRFVSLMGRRSAAQSDGESFRPIRAPKTSTVKCLPLLSVPGVAGHHPYFLQTLAHGQVLH